MHLIITNPIITTHLKTTVLYSVNIVTIYRSNEPALFLPTYPTAKSLASNVGGGLELRVPASRKIESGCSLDG